MCSRGLRFFFRTRNQVSNRKKRYRLTANHFEAALYEGCAKAKGADVRNAISVARIGFGELYIVEPSAQVGLVQALGIINLPSLRNRDGIPVMRNMVAVQAVSDQLRGDDGVDVGSIYHAPLSSVANPDVPRESVDLAANEA